MPNIRILLIIWLFGVTFAGAQSTGSINGSVTDAFGAYISEAMITLVRMEKGGETVVGRRKSDYQGKYQFVQIAPGSYEIRVEWHGLNRSFENILISPLNSRVFPL